MSIRPLATLLTALAALSHPLAAQRLAHTDLVPGAPARVEVEGLQAGAGALLRLEWHARGRPGLPFGFGVRARRSELRHARVGADGRARFELDVPVVPGATTARLTVLAAVGGTPTVLPAPGGLGVPLDGTGAVHARLSDELDGTALSGDWLPYRPDLWTTSVSNGALHIATTEGGPSNTWFADGTGPAMHKLVTGDFVATARVRSYDTTQPTAAPPLSYNMAGLNLLDPAAVPGLRNWLHVAVGTGTAQVPVCVEDKNTIDSGSSLVLHPIAEPRGEVRITRSGAWVHLSYRAPGGTWTLLRSHHRPDLPASVLVGPTAFSWTLPPRVGAAFDWVRFR